MNENFSKMRAFFTKHKKEIAITAVAGVVCVACIGITKKKLANITSFDDVLKWAHKCDNDDIGVLRQKGNPKHMVYTKNNIKLEEIGVFGKELTKRVGIKPDTKISALVEVTN